MLTFCCVLLQNVLRSNTSENQMLIYLLQVTHGPVEKTQESLPMLFISWCLLHCTEQGLGIFDDLIKFLCLGSLGYSFLFVNQQVICKKIIVIKVYIIIKLWPKYQYRLRVQVL